MRGDSMSSSNILAAEFETVRPHWRKSALESLVLLEIETLFTSYRMEFQLTGGSILVEVDCFFDRC